MKKYVRRFQGLVLLDVALAGANAYVGLVNLRNGWLYLATPSFAVAGLSLVFAWKAACQGHEVIHRERDFQRRLQEFDRQIEEWRDAWS